MKIGIVQRKILLVLLGGLALGLSGNPRQSFRIIKIIGKDWNKINQKEKRRTDNIQRSLKKLYDSKLVSIKENLDGTARVVLTGKGKEIAIEYDTKKIKCKKLKKWDKKWRIVIFDIPEDERAKRDVFRMRLKKLGFFELQKSVWISPINYGREIEYLIKVFNVIKYTKLITADSISNGKNLKKHSSIQKSLNLTEILR